MPVFPTCVGVFLTSTSVTSSSLRLPHVRGGVSNILSSGRGSYASSPRAWGCFYPSKSNQGLDSVFPTCVGVFPPPFAFCRAEGCLPHVRGGVSGGAYIRGESMVSSPRAWGCFCEDVKPCSTCSSLPHVRGGVSRMAASLTSPSSSSPRAWGCFHSYLACVVSPAVFPTCVGVFPADLRHPYMGTGLPHVRGGVSPLRRERSRGVWSSPRAWGCFRHRRRSEQKR